MTEAYLLVEVRGNAVRRASRTGKLNAYVGLTRPAASGTGTALLGGRAAASVLAAAVLLLGACAASGPVPEDRFYQLEPVWVVRSPVQAVFAQGLDVSAVSADPLRSGRAVLYRDTRKPLEVKRYHYEYWVEQPPRMVRQALLEYLHASGIAEPGGSGTRRGNAAYALKTHLKRFDRLVGGGAPKVEIELEASVYANSSAQPLWRNTYRHRQVSDGDDMHATAEAMQTALASVLQSMMEDLAAVDPAP